MQINLPELRFFCTFYLLCIDHVVLLCYGQKNVFKGTNECMVLIQRNFQAFLGLFTQIISGSGLYFRVQARPSRPICNSVLVQTTKKLMDC